MATTKKTNTAPLAAHAAKDVTATMTTFSEWLTSQTGYKVDPLSVQLGSALRGVWQAEQRATKESKPTAKAAPAKAKVAAKPAAKVAAKPAAEKPAPKPRAKRGSTVATTEGVVIAEQRHVEAV